MIEVDGVEVPDPEDLFGPLQPPDASSLSSTFGVDLGSTSQASEKDSTSPPIDPPGNRGFFDGSSGGGDGGAGGTGGTGGGSGGSQENLGQILEQIHQTQREMLQSINEMAEQLRSGVKLKL